MLNKFKVNNELQCLLVTYKTERWIMLACNWTCCNSFPPRFLNRIKGNFDKNEFNITKIEIQQWLTSIWIFFCFIQFCCCLVLFFRKGVLPRPSPFAGHSGMPFTSLSNSYGPESFYTSQPLDVQGGTFMQDPGLLITKQQCANWKQHVREKPGNGNVPLDGCFRWINQDVRKRCNHASVHWTGGFEVFSRITPRAEFSRKRCVDVTCKKVESSYKDWRNISVWKGCLSILLMLFSLKSLKSKRNWDQRAWNNFQFSRCYH